MKLMKIQRILYKVFVLLNLVLAICFMVYMINLSRGCKLWDSQVFYGVVRNLIAGSLSYRNFGVANLLFWYFPWVSWIFIPLALFPFEIDSFPFLAIGLSILALVIHSLAKHYQSLGILDRIYMFSI